MAESALITAKAAGLILGLSSRKVYDLAAVGRIPCYRYDTATFFKSVDVMEFRRSCRVQAVVAPNPGPRVKTKPRPCDMDLVANRPAFFGTATTDNWEPPAKLTPQQVRASAKVEATRRAERKAALSHFHTAKRRTAKLQRLPAWADTDAILVIYARAKEISALTGVPHHVDHILPLQGALVSGLHVAANLQIITASANSKKRNHFEVTP